MAVDKADTAESSDHHEGDVQVLVHGQITHVFGHRVVVHTADGAVLADVGPKVQDALVLCVNDTVRIEGERKPSEIKVWRIAVGHGDWVVAHGGGPKHDKHGHPKYGHDAEGFSAVEAGAIARQSGYEVAGAMSPFKKHFEGWARSGEADVFIEVHSDGRVKVKREHNAAA